jgi:cell division control protein 6
MGLFEGMLGAGETLFKDPTALEYDYMPKIIKGREEEQRKIAYCIKPLDQKRNGMNLVIFGPSGIGKTVVAKHMLEIVEEEADEIIPIYINCWKKNTSYKIMVKICEHIGYKLTHNKKTDELFEIAKKYLNRESAVIVLDEIDKAEELGFLYTLLEEIYRKTIIILTNEKSWLDTLDQRVKSRLMAETMEFTPYTAQETKNILEYRKKYAFKEGVFKENTFKKIVEKTVELGDIRSGLYLMKEAGNIAENNSKKEITKEEIEEATSKLDDFNIKNKDQLEEETKFVLKIIKHNPQMKIGELYKKYKEKGGGKTYKTFQRNIKKLSDNKFITTKKVLGGKEGTTTIVDYSKTKKITDF